MIGLGIFLFIISIVAFALSSMCGGGASFILLPILGWLLPGAQVPAALSIGTASSSISRIFIFWKTIKWEVVIWFVPPALPAVWLGSWLLTFVNPVYLELILGIFLLANFPAILKPAKEIKTTKPHSKWLLSLIGIAAGFVSGLTGAVGLLFNQFYFKYGMSKEQIIATRATNEILLHLMKLILYISFGLLTNRALTFGLIIAAAAIISSVCIKWILPLLSENLFKKIGYSAMVLSGMYLFLNASVTLVKTNNLGLSYSPIASGAETKLQWKKSSLILEFEYNEGFTFETGIAFKDLPPDKQLKVKSLTVGSKHIIIEEVFGINKHYYELYYYKDGKAITQDL